MRSRSCLWRASTSPSTTRFQRWQRSTWLVEIGVVPVTGTIGIYALADQVFGLGEGLARAQASDAVSAAEADNRVRDLQEADRTGEVFSAVSGFIVTGRKP